MHILIDDIRNLDGMDIIIRNAHTATTFIDTFDTTGHVLYMDNDLGHHSIEGRHLLTTLLELGQQPSLVVLVSSNPVGVADMQHTLKHYGYIVDATGRQFRL